MKPRYKIEYYKNDKGASRIIQLDLNDSIEEQEIFKNATRLDFDLYLYREVYLDENYNIIEEGTYERGTSENN